MAEDQDDPFTGSSAAARGAESREPLQRTAAGRALLARLLDPEHLLGVFRRTLPSLTDARISVEKGKAKLVRSSVAVREGKFHLLCSAWIRESGLTALRKVVLLGVAPVSPDFIGSDLEARSHTLRGHPLVEPFTRLSSYWAELKLGLMVYPMDPVLPGLAEITGSGAESLVAPHLPECRAGARLEDVACEIEHYKPFERAVLRVRTRLSGPHDAEAARTVYLKLFADDRGESGHEILSALWASARSSRYLRVPEPLGYDAQRRMLVLGEAPGAPILRGWFKRLARGEPLPDGVGVDRVRDCVLAAAGVVRDLQRSGVRPAARRTFQDELEKVRRKRALLTPDLARSFPGQVARLEELLERLERLAPADERLVPSHGSFRHKQMLVGEHGLTLVDWDSICLADPALDAATFLGLLVRPGGAPELEELAACFRREVLTLQPEVGTHLDLYEGSALAKRAMGALGSLSRDDREEAARETVLLAAAAEERLDRFERKVGG